LKDTKLSILITILACTCQEKNYYSLVCVNKIRELLAQYHGIHVGKRWIFQCLRYLEDIGLISRKPRYKHQSDGTIRQLSSIIAFTLKGALFLVSKKVKGAKKLMKKILLWIKTKDRRFPREKDIFKGEVSPLTPSDIEPFKTLINMVAKPMPP